MIRRRTRRLRRTLLILTLALLLLGASWGVSPWVRGRTAATLCALHSCASTSCVRGTGAAASPVAASPRARLGTVFLIVLENHNWADFADNRSAPYLNHVLLPQASRATQYYNPPGLHPSLPNYLWLEAGSNCGVLDDNPPVDNHQPTTAHLVTLLAHAGISWRAYEENIDGRTCPLTAAYPYAPKHNPFVYFDDVTGGNNPRSPTCIAHVRPYTDLGPALSHDTVAHYNMITPNLCNDGHDTCAPLHDPIRQTDAWLAHAVPPILRAAAYRQGGVLFITWDEGEGGADGPIGLLVLSPRAKGHGYTSTVHYTHSSLLRTVQEIFGVRPLLGDTRRATDLRALFTAFP